MLPKESSAPQCDTKRLSHHDSASELSLSSFLGDSLWWPEDDGSPHAGRLAGPATVPSNEQACNAARERLQSIRLFLAEGRFETIELNVEGQNCVRDNKGTCDHFDSPNARAGNSSKLGVNCSCVKHVPPCFALFTRFNCNVTLVAQRLFASKIAVSVFGGGMVVMEGDDIIRMVKYTRAGERVYKRHVMLHITTDESKHLANKQEPFSYGFLLALLQTLPLKARELVLSESMPFGAILDHCELNRSVEVERQLHIHITEGFFSLNMGTSQHDGLKSYTPNTADGQPQEQICIDHRQAEKGECQCEMMPKGVRCTFGRLTTIRCNGNPAARVVEILNAKLVLSALFAKEEEHQRDTGESISLASHPRDGSLSSGEQRTAFIAGRCLLSVARCPVHSAVLPQPHMTARELQGTRERGKECRLCASKTCSTDFQAAFTDDLP